MNALPSLKNEFSARTRQQSFQSLESQTFDLAIIGGGIVGAGVAYEAVRRGLRVVLVEKGDFASGTSSKSSKLLHGGLRYLEQYEFGLVFEALSARNQLIGKFPHLVKKVPFLIPIYRNYSEKSWLINIGCWLYDFFSWLSSPAQTIFHRFIDKELLLQYESTISQRDYQGGIQYFDAMCDDARLVLESLKTAQAAGAVVLNYTEVTAFVKNESNQVEGLVLQDRFTGQARTLRARKVINAAGPWADRINLLADPDYQRRLRPTKGIHIIVPKVTQAERAILLKSVPDANGVRRWIFIIPYGKYSIVGTTDTAHAGSDDDFNYLDQDNYASREDVLYMLASVNELYPSLHLVERDVISSYGGWRPLIAPPKADPMHESDISRAHEIFETATGIVVIAGGKLTTFLYMAEDLLQYLARHYPDQIRLQRTAELQPLCNRLEVPDPEQLQQQLLRQFPDQDPGWIRQLVSRYGSEALTILTLARQHFPGRSGLIGSLDEEVAITEIEVIYTTLCESALTLTDMLARRYRILLRDAHQGRLAAPRIAAVMGETLALALHWDAETQARWIAEQLALYQQELERTNAWKAVPLGV